jgi:hypothetical protein
VNVKSWIESVRDGKVFTHALAIVGPRGSGKGVAVKLLETAFPFIQSITVNASHFGANGLFDPLAIAVTETDLVTVDEVFTNGQLDAVKNIISERFIRVQIRGKGEEVRTPKANLIVTAQYFPVDTDRRFIVTTPIELIANLIPFLAR